MALESYRSWLSGEILMNSRIAAIEDLLNAHPRAFVLLSNGLTSREAAHFHRSERCFYMLHAMGETLAVGIGLARSRPDLEVVVIDGDGNALMGLSSWSLMPVRNVKYYVLANGAYETTGGQSLPGLPFVPSWCTIVPILEGTAATPNPPLPETIWKNTQDWLSELENSRGE